MAPAPRHARDPRTLDERLSLYSKTVTVASVVLVTIALSFLYLIGVIG
jgi:hypothetical protein